MFLKNSLVLPSDINTVDEFCGVKKWYLGSRITRPLKIISAVDKSC